jgi:hypothetical protein
VSLRKCPDCGEDVSSAALACPHCGRPNRARSAPIALSGMLVIAAACAGALIWHFSARSGAPDEPARAIAPQTTIAQPARGDSGLAATVGYNRRLFVLRVQNRDSFAWSNCELSINAQGVSSGYTRPVETIRPGITAAALLASAEFVDGDGHRFDPVTQQVATLDVACETPQGHRSYEGKFEPLRSSP